MNRRNAEKALKHVDVTLDLSDPASREPEQPALKLSRADSARLKLRTGRRFGRPTGNVAMTLPTMPTINALSFTIRYLPGGRKRFLEFVKLAALNGDPISEAWWKVFADLTPSERARCNFDDVAVAAGVKPSALLAGVVGHGMEAATDMGNLIAAALHPEVVAAAGKSALRIDGDYAAIAAEDRKSLLQARGMLPVPKGTSIHLHANASANAQAASLSAAEPSVPKFAEDMDAIAGQHGVVEGAVTAAEE